MLRFQLRTLFGPWHLVALAGLVATALLIPINSLSDLFRLRWLLTHLEQYVPLLLMPMSAGLLLVNGKVDERQGAAPGGLGVRFAQRWLLVVFYFALALGLFLALAGGRLEAFSWLRTFSAALVTAALFSLVGPLFHHATGSAPAGWATGMGLYFGTMLIAMFWCPADSIYQIWLPFAGLSDAEPGALALNKAAYGLAAAGLLMLNLRILQRPERLIGRSE